MRHSQQLMDRIRQGFPVILAGALALGCLAAQAADMQEVTVTVPATQTVGRDASGAPIEQVSASARVQYDPMMLASRSGRALLQQKVTDVARRLCREVNHAASPPAGDESSCVQQAVRRAKVQIAAAAVAQRAG